jgi:Uma2 family endonuclease
MTQVHETENSLGLWRFTVAKYHELIQSGVFDEDTPVELLEGWLVEKISKNPPHTLSTSLVKRLLERWQFSEAFVNTQDPITLSDSEPEPDVSLIRGSERDYADHHPRVSDVALVVEVADSSLKRDQTWKKRIYANAGIAQYWIVNLHARQLEVYTQPENGDYASRETFVESETARVTLEGCGFEFAVRDLLP